MTAITALQFRSPFFPSSGHEAVASWAYGVRLLEPYDLFRFPSRYLRVHGPEYELVDELHFRSQKAVGTKNTPYMKPNLDPPDPVSRISDPEYSRGLRVVESMESLPWPLRSTHPDLDPPPSLEPQQPYWNMLQGLPELPDPIRSPYRFIWNHSPDGSGLRILLRAQETDFVLSRAEVVEARQLLFFPRLILSREMNHSSDFLWYVFGSDVAWLRGDLRSSHNSNDILCQLTRDELSPAKRVVYFDPDPLPSGPDRSPERVAVDVPSEVASVPNFKFHFAGSGPVVWHLKDLSGVLDEVYDLSFYDDDTTGSYPAYGLTFSLGVGHLSDQAMILNVWADQHDIAWFENPQSYLHRMSRVGVLPPSIPLERLDLRYETHRRNEVKYVELTEPSEDYRLLENAEWVMNWDELEPEDRWRGILPIRKILYQFGVTFELYRIHCTPTSRTGIDDALDTLPVGDQGSRAVFVGVFDSDFNRHTLSPIEQAVRDHVSVDTLDHLLWELEVERNDTVLRHVVDAVPASLPAVGYWSNGTPRGRGSLVPEFRLLVKQFGRYVGEHYRPATSSRMYLYDFGDPLRPEDRSVVKRGGSGDYAYGIPPTAYIETYEVWVYCIERFVALAFSDDLVLDEVAEVRGIDVEHSSDRYDNGVIEYMDFEMLSGLRQLGHRIRTESDELRHYHRPCLHPLRNDFDTMDIHPGSHPSLDRYRYDIGAPLEQLPRISSDLRHLVQSWAGYNDFRTMSNDVALVLDEFRPLVGRSKYFLRFFVNPPDFELLDFLNERVFSDAILDAADHLPLPSYLFERFEGPNRPKEELEVTSLPSRWDSDHDDYSLFAYDYVRVSESEWVHIEWLFAAESALYYLWVGVSFLGCDMLSRLPLDLDLWYVRGRLVGEEFIEPGPVLEVMSLRDRRLHYSVDTDFLGGDLTIVPATVPAPFAPFDPTPIQSDFPCHFHRNECGWMREPDANTPVPDRRPPYYPADDIRRRRD